MTKHYVEIITIYNPQMQIGPGLLRRTPLGDPDSKSIQYTIPCADLLEKFCTLTCLILNTRSKFLGNSASLSFSQMTVYSIGMV